MGTGLRGRAGQNRAGQQAKARPGQAMQGESGRGGLGVCRVGDVLAAHEWRFAGARKIRRAFEPMGEEL